MWRHVPKASELFGTTDPSQVSQTVAPARNYLNSGAVTLTVGLSTRQKHASAVNIVTEAMYV